MFEMNVSGRMRTFVMAGAASALGMIVVAARPSAVKLADPNRSVASRPGSVARRIDTPYTVTASVSVVATSTEAVTSVDAILPARNAHGGSGVPRMRFRTPLSRETAVDEARLVKVAMIRP
jgi:hypothetical protein